jgi:hypothetical protein
MPLLNDTRTEPPGGWRYTQFETALRMEGGSLPELTDTVIAHRKYKGLYPQDRDSVQKDIERQLCQMLEPRFCRSEAGEPVDPIIDQTRGLSTDKALALSRTVFEALKQGKFTGVGESARRADICRRCPFNVSTSGCSCAPFYAAINLLVPKERLEKGVNLCAVCGCSLKAKIILPMEAVTAGNQGQGYKFPSYCWQNEHGN